MLCMQAVDRIDPSAWEYSCLASTQSNSAQFILSSQITGSVPMNGISRGTSNTRLNLASLVSGLKSITSKHLALASQKIKEAEEARRVRGRTSEEEDDGADCSERRELGDLMKMNVTGAEGSKMQKNQRGRIILLM
nr:hypothetical protein Iba_chr07cCG7020 [Ipomoea batatas]